MINIKIVLKDGQTYHGVLLDVDNPDWEVPEKTRIKVLKKSLYVNPESTTYEPADEPVTVFLGDCKKVVITPV
jgi:hypothetical protein